VTEAINCLIWRQQDAVRNSIQSCARSVFSDSECKNKNQSMMQEMIFQKSDEFKGKIIDCGWIGLIDFSKENFNWNDIPDKTKRGITAFYENGELKTSALDIKENSTFI